MLVNSIPSITDKSNIVVSPSKENSYANIRTTRIYESVALEIILELTIQAFQMARSTFSLWYFNTSRSCAPACNRNISRVSDVHVQLAIIQFHNFINPIDVTDN